VVRHGLGSSVYEINDLSPKKKKLIVDLPMESDQNFQPSNDAYRSAFPGDDEFGAAFEALDQDLAGQTSFLKYIPPDPRTNASAAHSLLCDLGFLSADTHEITRRVPPSLFDLLDNLDSTSARTVTIIFILQLIADDPSRQLTSKETPALNTLLTDLQVPECSICSFSLIAPVRQSKQPVQTLAALAMQSGFMVVLNESGQKINSRCPDLENVDVLLVLTVQDENMYNVELSFQNLAVFGSFQIGNISITLHHQNLAQFITICAFLFFATPGRTRSNGCTQAKGPDQFFSGFYTRCAQIAQIFEKSEIGRNAILLGCLSCGLPEEK
jgi:hypothetical protein